MKNYVEVNGKYGKAIITASLFDDTTISQAINVMNQPFAKDSHLVLMPDCHAGSGCVIGTTMKITDKVCPNLVGVDIACGMYVTKLTNQTADAQFLKDLDETINRFVPSGMSTYAEPLAYPEVADMQRKLSDLRCNKVCQRQIESLEHVFNSIGTLGGGNHFIELNRGDDGDVYLVIHSGSRYLGKAVCNYYMDAASNEVTSSAVFEQKSEIIAKLKAEGRQREISEALSKVQAPKFDKDLVCCTGSLFDDYIHDIKIVNEYADLNRKLIVKRIQDKWVGAVKPVFEECFTTKHNYIDTDAMILRKGAVSAKEGELLIIPMNMRDGSLICRGLGNADWNYSAPHGSGRVLSRSQAKSQISLEEFEESMSGQGIYTTSVCQSTIDESPMVYKPTETILADIEPTVEVLQVIKPIYNYKAH